MLAVPRALAARAENFVGRIQAVTKILHWIENDTSPLLCITGPPGTGKSTLLAWLAGAGQSLAGAENAESSKTRERVREEIDAAHFCVASQSGNDPSLDPWGFAQHLGQQFASRFPSYGLELSRSLGPSINIVMTTGRATSVTGPQFGDINLANAASLFNRVCDALSAVPSGETGGAIVVLVDSLDEALLWPAEGGSTIPELILSRVGGDQGVPLRFLATSRREPDVTDRIQDDWLWDVILDASEDRGDVAQYISHRVSAEAPHTPEDFISRVDAASDGNFLYARLALDYWLRELAAGTPLGELELPPGLDGIYSLFLQREYGTPQGRRDWEDDSRPLLGTLGVAQQRMPAQQLQWILGLGSGHLQDALRRCEQYLDGDRPDGPFGVYHQSFRQFLFDSQKNASFSVSASEWHGSVAKTYLTTYGSNWENCSDDYGLTFACTHLAEAARGSIQPQRDDLTRTLVQTVNNTSFRAAHEGRIGDDTALLRDLERAMVAASMDDHPGGIIHVVHSALALVTFRRDRLQPEEVFRLAASGDLPRAVRRLEPFPLDPRWHEVALLCCAWVAAARNPQGARQLLHQVEASLPTDPPLPRLMERVVADLDGRSVPTALPPPPPHEIARAIVARLGGVDFRRDPSQLETLSARGLVSGHELREEFWTRTENGSEAPDDYQPIFIAEREGPVLVAFAAADPVQGDPLVRQYVSLHAGNGYAHYRNQSLLALLHSIVEHPRSEWVKEFVRQVVSGSMSGEVVDFREALPLAFLALAASTGRSDAERILRDRRDEMVRAMDHLPGQPRRLAFDSWGAHKRRLSSLAEAFAVGMQDLHEGRQLLDLAYRVPFGFAGYTSPACLTLAEAAQICDPNPYSRARVDDALTLSRSSAHNVQDPLLCAWATSRWNTMAREWWQDFGVQGGLRDVHAIVDAFVENPSHPRFTALHIVGEEYEDRQETDTTVPLPPRLREANSLSDLSASYQFPLPEFVRVNEGSEWDPSAPLSPGTEVRVPDPAFLALLAPRLAAEVLVSPELGPDQRVDLIRRLVPTASSNVTALDTVLARLLLAEPMNAHWMLGELEFLLAEFATPPDESPVYELEVMASRFQVEDAGGYVTGPTFGDIG